MSRTVRKVPKDWQHPKDENGNYIPMHEHFPYTPEEIREGLLEGWLVLDKENFGIPIMPDWSDGERTHLMMYETTSEGTPLSPAFARPEELAHWLVNNNASASGSEHATYNQWLAMIRRGWASTFVYTSGVGLKSGVADCAEGNDSNGGN